MRIAADFGKTQSIAVKIRHDGEVADKQNNVAEFLDAHTRKLHVHISIRLWVLESGELAAAQSVVGKRAFHQFPKTARMVESLEMAELVDDDVVGKRGRQIDKPVVEREIARRRAAPPKRFLARIVTRPPAKIVQAVKIRETRFDQDTGPLFGFFERFAGKNGFGCGYTLHLPITAHQPGMTFREKALEAPITRAPRTGKGDAAPGRDGQAQMARLAAPAHAHGYRTPLKHHFEGFWAGGLAGRRLGTG